MTREGEFTQLKALDLLRWAEWVLRANRWNNPDNPLLKGSGGPELHEALDKFLKEQGIELK